jgi:hypothetical protein
MKDEVKNMELAILKMKEITHGIAIRGCKHCERAKGKGYIMCWKHWKEYEKIKERKRELEEDEREREEM